jgi:hypothetical protein
MEGPITVSSSNVQSIAYAADDKQLLVQFKNGTSYVYYDVPSETWDGLKSASSTGGYLAQHIKNSYRYERKF